MTENVFELTKNLRVTDKSKVFQGILQRLRLSKQEFEDAETLNRLNLGMEGIYDDLIPILENDPKTLWIYATNDDRMEKNRKKLRET